MTQQILIQHGVLVTPAGEMRADLRLVDERIHTIGLDLKPEPGEEVIDAHDCVILPGLVDPHTHIQLDTGVYRTPDDWAVGTRTAACGGVTTVIDFATQFPGQDVRQAVSQRLEEAHYMAHVDYGLHVMLTDLPAADSELAGWMADLAEMGTPSAKVYTTYRPNYYQNDHELLRVFQAAGRQGVMVMAHCENDALVTATTAGLMDVGQDGLAFHGQSRPPLAEVEAVSRCLLLAQAASCPLYIVHCSVAQSVALIQAARQAGQTAFAETCPQYLLLDESAYAGEQPEWAIMQPPLRPVGEPERLWEFLASGAISSIGSDHCDYTLWQKHGLQPLENADVQAALEPLSEEQREMVILRAGLRDGWRRQWVEVARALGTSREAVRRTETAVIRRLRDVNGALATLREAGLVTGRPRLPFTQTPGGVPGLETTLPLLAFYGVAAGRLTWTQLARLVSTNPARLFGLYPRKGALQPGSDADVVIFNPRTEWTVQAAELHNIAGYTPYEGRQLQGRVRMTFSRGRIVYRNGEFLGQQGWGRFVAGRPFEHSAMPTG